LVMVLSRLMSDEAALFTFLFVLQILVSWMVMVTDDLVMNF